MTTRHRGIAPGRTAHTLSNESIGWGRLGQARARLSLNEAKLVFLDTVTPAPSSRGEEVGTVPYMDGFDEGVVR